MGEKFTTQRATEIAAGGFPVNALGKHTKKLTNQDCPCPAINSSTVTTVACAGKIFSTSTRWTSSLGSPVSQEG